MTRGDDYDHDYVQDVPASIVLVRLRMAGFSRNCEKNFSFNKVCEV
jgi:hypothetical protein